MGGNGFGNLGLEFNIHDNITYAIVVGLNKCCHEFLQLRMNSCCILKKGEVLELGPKFTLVETMGLEIGIEIVSLEGSRYKALFNIELQ